MASHPRTTSHAAHGGAHETTHHASTAGAANPAAPHVSDEDAAAKRGRLEGAEDDKRKPDKKGSFSLERRKSGFGWHPLDPPFEVEGAFAVAQARADELNKQHDGYSYRVKK